MSNPDPGPGGGRRDKRDDGCWLRSLKAALAVLACCALVACGWRRYMRHAPAY